MTARVIDVDAHTAEHRTISRRVSDYAMGSTRGAIITALNAGIAVATICLALASVGGSTDAGAAAGPVEPPTPAVDDRTWGESFRTVGGDPDVGACWEQADQLRPFADRLATPMVCMRIEGRTGGLYDGAALVVVEDGHDANWFGDAMAHELGHAWSSHRLDADDAATAAMLLGWTEWDDEAYADVVALALGWWRDYGDGWRHNAAAFPKPSPAQLDVLRTAGLAPDPLPRRIAPLHAQAQRP